MISVLWFSWARERVGCAEEQISLPDDNRSLGQLLALLRLRSEAHEAVLSAPGTLRFAVNHEMAGLDHTLSAGDEVAIFPPVTGG